MLSYAVRDWSDAYTNTIHIAGGERWPQQWVEPARAYRESLQRQGRARLDLAYGPASRNRLDLFLPQGKPRGLMVFVHGGFWMALDNSYWSHLAAGAVDNGFAVAMPSYTLCPEIRLTGIVGEIAAAIAFAADEIDGPVFLSGHSAGGHLVTRMMCAHSPLPAQVRKRIRRVLSLSGLHDLRPLLRIPYNETMRIDEAEAFSQSPALLEPAEGLDLICWVGAAERAEFVRQNALLANIWIGLGASTCEVMEPDLHHYNVIDGLADKNHAMTRALLFS